MKKLITKILKISNIKIEKGFEKKEVEGKKALINSKTLSIKDKKILTYTYLISSSEVGRVAMWNINVLYTNILTYSKAENNWYKTENDKKVNIFITDGTFFCYKNAISIGIKKK